MRLSSADFSDTLEPRIARSLRKKLLRNYTSWCGFLGRRPNVYVPDDDPRADLLFAGLHLLVWGEAANLRFMPECICYIYHHMALELHRILEGYIDTATGRPANPAVNGENAFLTRVITPVYGVIRAEVESSHNGTVPHAAWRNYDDINEYFWRRDVFDRLGWPMEQSRQFFRTPPDRSRVRKTGFVEVRSFWNIYRSFDRLWVMLVLYMQAAAIIAWNGETWPWQNFRREAQVHLLTVFITWAALRFLQSLLDIGTQFRRAFRDSRMLAVRMVLKAIVAAVWVLVFAILYKRILNQRDSDRGWSRGTDARIMSFLYAAAVFVLPEVLAILLFIIPWVRNALEKTNWKICYALTWWFQSRSFVGRGLREGTWDNVKYSLFWVLLLAVKFTFSYFLQIRPLVKPTQEIYKLGKITYAWHEFFGQSNRFAVLILERKLTETSHESLKLCEVLHQRPLASLPTSKNCLLGKIEEGTAEWQTIANEAARTIPGRENGGNCDIKNLSRGSKVYLPVFVEGANLSTGDMHFSQESELEGILKGSDMGFCLCYLERSHDKATKWIWHDYNMLRSILYTIALNLKIASA
uniref:Uncharacterized protein n=1 Tax=Avena sativa TaxID=4498 RepID=A0ACD6ATA7_AVESA